ncbi:unnamed protein product [Brassicogethes aeneus]|uniref:Uncharacterized protein n=1 Tax=Brassicogethes aeneus TaxID=1431903 RepID=A0A9P0FNF6_BRAAE|nr:unnamed protein product [Brassicogethes aeneus]
MPFKSKKVVIPKGLINPCENTIVEVPPNLKKQPIVIVKYPNQDCAPDPEASSCPYKPCRPAERNSELDTSDNVRLMVQSNSQKPKVKMEDKSVGTMNPNHGVHTFIPLVNSTQQPNASSAMNVPVNITAIPLNQAQIIQGLSGTQLTPNLIPITSYSGIPNMSMTSQLNPCMQYQTPKSCNICDSCNFKTLNARGTERMLLEKDIERLIRARRRLKYEFSDDCQVQKKPEYCSVKTKCESRQEYLKPLEKNLIDIKKLTLALSGSKKSSRAVLDDTMDLNEDTIADKEDKELTDIEKAVKDFQMARRNLISKLKEYSSSQLPSTKD